MVCCMWRTYVSLVVRGADGGWCSLFVTWVLWVAAAASITASLNGGLDCKYVSSALFC